MKTLDLRTLLILVWLLACTGPASAEHREVILLGGQSNMVGSGDINRIPPSDPLRSPLEDVLFYYRPQGGGAVLPANSWVNLQVGGSGGSLFGPELSFGHALNSLDPGGNYALIKYAQNGTDVHTNWNPEVSDNVYSVFRETVDSALQTLIDAGDTYEIVGMLWTQGIRDGRDARSASEYQEDLEDLISDVRLNYGSDIPVFISRLSVDMVAANVGAPGECRVDRNTPVCPDDPTLPDYGLTGIRMGQEGVAANDPLAYLIDTDAFEVVGSHFTTNGSIALGEAFATSYYQNVVVPEPSAEMIGVSLLGIGAVWRHRRVR